MQGLKKHPYSYVSITIITLLTWIMIRGEKDRKLGEWLDEPFWKPPSPPADSLDDPAPLISASYTLSLRVFLEGFTKTLKWGKHSEVFECPSKYLSATKVLWKHCETWAIIESCFPFCQTGKYQALIVSSPCGLETSLFFFAQRTHQSVCDCAWAIAALNKQQQGPCLQFPGFPMPFVRWYQL